MAEVIELQKLKLAELRQECEARGLETKGNKGDLIARLQTYLEEHEEDSDVNVDDVLSEDTARLQKRAERFNIPATAESKKAVRAARFGLPATTTSPAPGVVASGKAAVSVDLLKKRAERFGMNVSSITQKVEEDEKLKKRKERFGILTSAAGAGDAEAKKMKRAERFGKV
ncbi:hypothetical protein CRUP_038783 [Coryphaenoides rupestris]|nr:hypothetical protein CRUP_038783 [Coryphaenoides rupestris]